jgi:hypothetical protein
MTMPKPKKPTRQSQPRAKAEVAVARRPRLLDQAIAKARAAVEAALDFADEAAEKLSKSLRA